MRNNVPVDPHHRITRYNTQLRWLELEPPNFHHVARGSRIRLARLGESESRAYERNEDHGRNGERCLGSARHLHLSKETIELFRILLVNQEDFKRAFECSSYLFVLNVWNELVRNDAIHGLMIGSLINVIN